jgi:hypothetical protein
MAADKRGPKLGDAASLCVFVLTFTRSPAAQFGPRQLSRKKLPLSQKRSWNFTPSPGWTKDEAATLKLCLMHLGVGKWKEIQVRRGRGERGSDGRRRRAGSRTQTQTPPPPSSPH